MSMDSINSLIDQLTNIKPVEYWKSKTPSAADSELYQLMVDIYRGDKDDRTFVFELLDVQAANILTVFSERMVSLAIKEQEKRCLLIGLFALSFCFHFREKSESQRILSLYHDAIMRLNLDEDQVFALVTSRCPADQEKMLYHFAQMEPQQKTISHYGIEQVGMPNGLQYRPC